MNPFAWISKTWLWRFLDGWKTWLWAIVEALKIAFPSWPIWGFVDSVANSVGWQHLVPAIDPGQLVQWGTFAIAIGHRLYKAVQQYRAGVPVVALNSGPDIVSTK